MRAAEAVLAGGISIFEITMTVPDAPAVIRALVERLGDRAVVGAGTVLDADDARTAASRRAPRSSSARASTSAPSPPRTSAACRSCRAR